MQSLFRYQEIAADLREQIRRGKFAGNTRLPPEREMMARYGVQRNTIRQALTLLQTEGWLQVRPRSGAFAVSQGGAGAQPAAAPVAEGIILVINAWNHSSTALDRILVGLSHATTDTAFAIQRFNSQPRPPDSLHLLPSPDYLAANRVVGAILWAQNPTDLGDLTRLRDSIPLILIDRRVVGFETDCVRFEDRTGGQLITRHLIERGHTRIGFMGDEPFAETVQERWHGYALAMEEAGLGADLSPFAFQGIREPLFANYMRVFLAGAGRPLTAVVCSNDITALTLLRFLRAEGRSVPDDVAVTGYGNLLSDYLDALDLTTVEQPFEEAGRAAGRLLCKRLDGTAGAAGYEQISLPVHVIARNSSRGRDEKL